MLEHGIVPASAGGYEIANSLRFNDNDSAYLSWTPSSAGNQKTFTWSGWVKRGNLSTEQHPFLSAGSNSSNYVRLGRFNTNDTINIYSISGGSDDFEITTTQVFRDVSAWYHIVFAVDTTQATASNRVKLYVNGEQITNFSTASYPSQNFDFDINNTSSHYIGRRLPASSSFHDGYLAEVNFIDGQALSPTDFGETGDYGEWKPIRYTGTYGTNGFYLDFENSGSLGADVSGNSNNWTPTNLAATDQMLDSPTNNFCTLNALAGNTSIALAEGNLEFNPSATAGNKQATFGLSSGKWYWEICVNNLSSYQTHGITTKEFHPTDYDENYGYGSNGWKYIGTSGSAYGASYTSGDILSFTLDMDTGTFVAYKNNVSQGTLYSGFTETMFPYLRTDGTGNCVANFGQDSSFAGNKTAQGNTDGNGYGDFYYTPPTGYLALCTQNLPDPAVIPSEHFNTVLYTGTGASDNSITGVGFTPDFVWLKDRSTVVNHQLMDRLRSNGTVRLRSDVTDAEDQYGLKSLDSDGFTTDGAIHNTSSSAYVSWNWKANGSGVSNTNGSITSTVSANQDAGFSIVSYTGTGSAGTVGHGLSSTPEIIFYKNRDSALAWFVQMDGSIIDSLLGGTEAYKFRLLLNSTGALTFDTGHFSANPTSSTFAIGTSGYTNASSANHLAYCFHSVDGFSKVGSYTGNGSTDGTFVYTGFRPAYVMVKRTNDVANWVVVDNDRNTYNVVANQLAPDTSGAETTNANLNLDMLSNGFKLKAAGGGTNVSGSTYIFVAFAENPFKHTNAR